MHTAPGSFSRQGHLAWAFIAVFFASMCAAGAGILELGLEQCAGCGTFGFGSLCSSPAPNFCSGTFALSVSLLTIVTGLCLLFAVHAAAAFRMKRGLPIPSLLSSSARSRSVVFDVLGLTVLAWGVEFVLVGLVMSLDLFYFHGTCEGCPYPPYMLTGNALTTVIVGIVIALVGAVPTLVRFRRLSRSANTTPL